MGWGSILGAIGKGALSLIPGGGFASSALDLVGKGASGAAQSMANNRGNALDASLTRDQLATSRQAEDRAERDDAWKKLQQAAYLMNYKPVGPTTLSTSQGPRTLPSFGFGPQAPSDAELQGAQGLEKEVMRRLQGGSQLGPLTNVDKYAKQSGWEKLLGITGAIAPVLGAAGRMKKQSDPYAGDYGGEY